MGYIMEVPGIAGLESYILYSVILVSAGGAQICDLFHLCNIANVCGIYRTCITVYTCIYWACLAVWKKVLTFLSVALTLTRPEKKWGKQFYSGLV